MVKVLHIHHKGNLLDPLLHDDNLDNKYYGINHKYYDIVIYGSYHR